MGAGSMYVILWEFRVRAEAVAEFERLYGPAGAWASLFRAAPGYLGTELLRDAGGGPRYLTLDRWASPGAYADFRRRQADAYAALDREGEGLTEAERLVGEFTAHAT